MMTAVRRLMCLVTAGLAATGLITACQSRPRAISAPPPSTSRAALDRAPSATPRTPATPVQASEAPSPRSVATKHLAAIARRHPAGAISVAALNTGTGAKFRWGARGGMWTASCYKLLVLETLLRANHGPLYGYQGSQAVAMIENSDNKAGYALFLAAGGNDGVQDALKRFGMRHTVLGISDPTFTRTSASDYLYLLRNLVGPGPLTPGARAYAKNLLRNVEADQRWGVAVVADKDSDFYIKNGWLGIDNDNGPGEDDDGLWAVNSVGIVRVRGQQVLMAVFTRHDPDYDTGVHLVERLARVIAPAVAAPR